MGGWGKVVAGAVVVVGAVLLMPAGADASLDGPCRATGTITPGDVRINPKRGDGPFTVPLEGTVNWVGRIGNGDRVPERRHNGEITVEAPPGWEQLLGSLLEFRAWGEEDAVTTRERGTDEYTLPSLTPRGTDIPVSGFHDDELGQCDGAIVVQVEGGALDTPLAWGAIGGTVVTGAGLAFAAMARRP